jgi:multicomponent Na+:H+ antiporter subunit C
VPADEYSDPLPQALILTAIVITFAVTAFLLAMIYRSWTLTSADELTDDTEDIKVSQKTAYDEEEDSPVAEDTTEFVDEEGRPVREGEE